MSENEKKPTEKKLRFARQEIVERLDREIERGDVLNLIELLDDLRRDLLKRTEDGRLFDKDLDEYQEYFSELTTVRTVMDFLERLNEFGPESELTEARRILEERFGERAGGWLK